MYKYVKELKNLVHVSLYECPNHNCRSFLSRRRVVEYGTYVKHLKVEVYLFNLKVCVHPHINETKQVQFSRADYVGK